jgi:ArsR family transcriptional regulator
MTEASSPKISCEAGEHPAHNHTLRSESVLSGAAVLFHALGDTERLRLMELLFDGPHCVSELAEETGQSMSMISQRLKILHHAKLVQKQRSGKHIYYALWDEHIVHLLENAFAHVEEPNS